MAVPQQTYENLDAPTNNAWLENSQKAKQRSKWIVSLSLNFHYARLLSNVAQVIGSVIALAVLIGLGVGLGVALSKKSSNNSTSSTSSGSVPSGTNPNDPTNFPKNSALKQSFYGIAYTPLGSQTPDCGNSLSM
jgi:hypothetical protein